MGSRVYVGNLSWHTSWQSLKDHFRQAGEVVHADVMQHDGRSKGCGIVAFATAQEAANAIATLGETELDGRTIFVREDREAAAPRGLPAPGTRAPAPAGKFYGGGLPAPRSPALAGGAAAGGSRVYVGNLSWHTSWQSLKDHFRQAGEVVHADVMQHDGRSKGCGIVAFATAQEAANAIATLGETELDGRTIFVREDREAAPPTAGSGGRARAGTVQTSGCQVYVGNLPYTTSWKELKDHFKVAGNVTHADVAQDGGGKSRGFGTVLFGSTREAAKAIQIFNESEFHGRTIEVRPDQYS
mmetsp:Transcript_4109/g.13289  ORF Transcript_4109/g.13289 Transcript_4109/m.13289 type:complete len:299 (-) Transcript_4109:642-1538(-)